MKRCHMRGRRWALWIAAVAWFAVPAVQAQVSPDVVNIEIDSRWGGLSPEAPFCTQLVIQKEGAGYRLSGSQSKGHGERYAKSAIPSQSVSAAKVADLVDALRQPMQPSLDPALLRPVFASLQEHLDVLALDLVPETSPVHAKVVAWRQTLRDPGALAAAATRGLDARHTDDNPGVRVRAAFADGTVREISSRAQQYLMLPWEDAQGERTYAIALPLAVAALMPADSTNKERLERSRLPDWNDLLDNGLAEDAHRFEAEVKAPEAFRLLSAHFELAEIDTYPEGKTMDVELRLPRGPKNLALYARLDLKGTALADSHMVDRMEQQLKLAEAAPGMSRQIADHPHLKYSIDRFGWHTLREKTQKQFVAEMQDLGKLPELKTDPSLMEGAVLVSEGWSPTYWMVLADRRTVLWKKYAPGEEVQGGMRCASVPSPYDEDGSLAAAVDKDDVCFGTAYDGR